MWSEAPVEVPTPRTVRPGVWLLRALRRLGTGHARRERKPADLILRSSELSGTRENPGAAR